MNEGLDMCGMNGWGKAQVLLLGMPSSSTAIFWFLDEGICWFFLALSSVAFAVMLYRPDLSIASDMDPRIIIFANSRQGMDNLDNFLCKMRLLVTSIHNDDAS